MSVANSFCFLFFVFCFFKIIVVFYYYFNYIYSKFGSSGWALTNIKY
jgi:hypothetical protein